MTPGEGVLLPPLGKDGPGNVLAVGIDLVEIGRIREVYQRQGDRFIDRVFTDAEKAYCLLMNNPHPHLAARFAAKEAVSKCFGCGISGSFGWRSASVERDPEGRPYLSLDAKGKALLREKGATEVSISLTHTRDLAMAIALLLKTDQR